MDGGLASTRYACEKCGASYHVKPTEITVLYGKPANEPDNKEAKET